MARSANYRRIKSARTYTIEGAADALSISVVTVRGFEKQGLRVLKSQRPFLILGTDLREFLKTRTAKRRQTLELDEFLCLRCKAGRRPLGNMVDATNNNLTTFRMTALCCVCEGEMNRFVKRSALSDFQSIWDITFRDADNT